MKKLSLILNLVLLVAVGYLYYVQFMGSKEEPIITLPKQGSNMVYVNADSLFENYDYYKDLKVKMEVNRKNTQVAFEAKAKALEAEFTQYQQKASSLSPEQRQKIEAVLGQKQQEFLKSRDAISQNIEEAETKIHGQLYDKIGKYLRTQSKSGYQIVFGYAKGGGILYANDSLNITNAILKGLNASYAKEPKEEVEDK